MSKRAVPATVEFEGKQVSFYDILNVSCDATPDIISKAFRKKARQHHPDLKGDTETFKTLSFVKDILLNPEARQRYDEKMQADDENNDNYKINEMAGIMNKQTNKPKKKTKQTDKTNIPT